MKYVSDLISEDEIKTWKKGDNILIRSNTGTGKSYFIYNTLANTVNSGEKILLLTNRVMLKNQFNKYIKKYSSEDTIEVMTYQRIENGQVDLSEYDYVVVDEFHYFMSDIPFNHSTEVSLREILSNDESVTIMMSATGEMVQRYLTTSYDEEVVFKNYHLASEINTINKLYSYNQDKSIEDILDTVIHNNEKAIVFIDNVDKLIKLHAKYKDNSSFICSSSHRESRRIDENAYDDIINKESFSKNVLFTTSALVNGVNIKDERLKHIVIDSYDTEDIVQSVGRKRMLHQNDKVNVYVKNKYEHNMKNRLRYLKAQYMRYDFLNKHGVKEYVNRYGRSSHDSSGIIYYAYTDKGIELKINTLALEKLEVEIFILENMIELGYMNMITRRLRLDTYTPYEDKGDYDRIVLHIEEQLKKHGEYIMLTNEDREPLINAIQYKRNGRVLKSIKPLNERLLELNIPYQVEVFRTSRSNAGIVTKYQRAWRIRALE